MFILLVEEKKGLKILWRSHMDDGSKLYDLLVISLRCFYRSLPALNHSESAQISTSWYSQKVTKNNQRKCITIIYVLQVLIWSTVTFVHNILRSQIRFRRCEISFPSWRCGCGCRRSYLSSPTPSWVLVTETNQEKNEIKFRYIYMSFSSVNRIILCII